MDSLGTFSAFYQVIFLSLIFIGFAAYSLKTMISGKDASSRIQKQGTSPLLGSAPMEFVYWAIKPIGGLASKLKMSPNFFSWNCLIFGLASGVSVASGGIFLGGVLFIASGLFDALDGMVARARGIASDAGEVLDAAVDRYGEFFFIGGLVIYYRFNVIAMIISLFALLGSYLVSYSQAKAEAMGIHNIPKGWMRRPERMTYLSAGALLSPIIGFWTEIDLTQHMPFHYFLLLCLGLVGFLGNLSAIQRFVFLYKAKLPGKAS